MQETIEGLRFDINPILPLGHRLVATTRRTIKQLLLLLLLLLLILVTTVQFHGIIIPPWTNYKVGEVCKNRVCMVNWENSTHLPLLSSTDRVLDWFVVLTYYCYDVAGDKSDSFHDARRRMEGGGQCRRWQKAKVVVEELYLLHLWRIWKEVKVLN